MQSEEYLSECEEKQKTKLESVMTKTLQQQQYKDLWDHYIFSSEVGGGLLLSRDCVLVCLHDIYSFYNKSNNNNVNINSSLTSSLFEDYVVVVLNDQVDYKTFVEIVSKFLKEQIH